ncbi:MAG: cytochrome c biosis protein transrane region [Solirubrobacterales bacterium]|jgi:cytochrome c-type biogenesis protein|nr:cytochrome c biosis protein transrane region [Solirubrobacterales bacterium]
MCNGTGVGVLTAAFAGLVSFLSPCVLPLVPGYLSAVAGVAPDELRGAGARRVLGPSLLFVLAFSAIFILLGLSATAIGSTLTNHKTTLEKISGALIVVMGAFFLLTPFVLRLNREWHVDGLMQRAGRGGPLVAGAAFAIAWTPCIGPTLGAILTLAAASHSEGHGALLLAFYCLGLAVPFVLTALFFGYMTSAFEAVKRHYRVIVVAGGALLVVTGVLVFSGQFAVLNQQAQSWFGDSGVIC